MIDSLKKKKKISRWWAVDQWLDCWVMGYRDEGAVDWVAGGRSVGVSSRHD